MNLQIGGPILMFLDVYRFGTSASPPNVYCFLFGFDNTTCDVFSSQSIFAHRSGMLAKQFWRWMSDIAKPGMKNGRNRTNHHKNDHCNIYILNDINCYLEVF